MTHTGTQEWAQFFHTIFQSAPDSYICVALKTKDGKYREEFFKYPIDFGDMLGWFEKNAPANNLYFCTQPLKEPKRKRDLVEICTCLWADLDGPDWTELRPAPSIVIESSPGKYHVYWLLTEPVPAKIAEEACKRIAYSFHADKSGWDLSQVLRVPNSYNFKYGIPTDVKIVKLETTRRIDVNDVLEFLPPVEGSGIGVPRSFPTVLPTDTAEFLLTIKYAGKVSPGALTMFQDEPPQGNEDWSTVMWRFLCLLFEGGMSREEALIVAREAPFNKYVRDNRPELELWVELCKAYDSVFEKAKSYAEQALELLPKTVRLLTEADSQYYTDDWFVDKYVEWAVKITDADRSFHEVGAFVLLSTLLSKALRIKTDVGLVLPNIWAMILGETTISRKSTSMRMVMQFIKELMPDAFVATDGSPEGITDALANRPGKPSLVMRDEFSGMMLKMQNQKGYQSDLMQFFTWLYDGDGQRRRLKNRDIEINDPVFLMFTGGIKSRILELADYEAVASGFFPRFIFAIAHNEDGKAIKSLRPSQRNEGERTDIAIYLERLVALFNAQITMRMKDGTMIVSPKVWEVELSDEAWERFDQLQNDMRDIARANPMRDQLMPILERLGISILKCAVLLQATKMKTVDEKLVLELPALIKAISFGEQWAMNGIEVCAHAGFTATERQLQKVYHYIIDNSGITRSKVMQFFRLSSKEAELLIDTLDQRGLIVRKREGRGEKLWMPSDAYGK